jgi:hypothetical protein
MTDFSAVSELGELDPDYFEELMAHPETAIKIHHDGEVLFGEENPTQAQIARPRMVDAGGTKKASFKVNLVVERVMPDPVEGLGDEDSEEDHDDENDHENHLTFSMSDDLSR